MRKALDSSFIMGDELLLQFHMWNYKIAMKTCHASQYQDGDEVLKCYEWRRQGIKASFRKPKHTKEHIKKDCLNRYFMREWSSWSLRQIQDKHVKNPRLRT